MEEMIFGKTKMRIDTIDSLHIIKIDSKIVA